MTEPFPEPWYPIAENQRLVFERELQRELGANHRLAGLSLRIVARRDDQDDVFVVLDNGGVAEVHLTWTGKWEVNPTWPETHVFGSMSEWRLHWDAHWRLHGP